MADMETQKDLQKITDNADAATPTATEFKEAPIASLTGQRFEAPAEEHHSPNPPRRAPSHLRPSPSPTPAPRSPPPPPTPPSAPALHPTPKPPPAESLVPHSSRSLIPG